MLTATPVQTDDDDLYTLLNTLRPDVILDKKTFKEMQEPNAEINAAARLIRHQAENWRSEAAEHLFCAAQTSWGRSVIEDNPTYKRSWNSLRVPSHLVGQTVWESFRMWRVCIALLE